MSQVAATPIAGPPGLTRNRDFLKLWVGQTISVAGTQVTQLALPLIAATTLNVTPFEPIRSIREMPRPVIAG